MQINIFFIHQAINIEEIHIRLWISNVFIQTHWHYTPRRIRRLIKVVKRNKKKQVFVKGIKKNRWKKHTITFNAIKQFHDIFFTVSFCQKIIINVRGKIIYIYIYNQEPTLQNSEASQRHATLMCKETLSKHKNVHKSNQ